MTLAEEMKGKHYDPVMDWCDVDGIVHDILERATQVCDKVGDECADETNKQTARMCSFGIRAMMDAQRGEVQP